MSDWKNGNGHGDIINSTVFAGLDDVSFDNLQNGQIPKYNSTTQKWENANESGGGGTVTDVQVDGTSVVNQQGVAEITMPTPPTPDYPVTDVKVNGTSVVSNKQALITSYKEVTQAQYEALPDTKLSDGVLYAIKDGGQAIEGFPPLIYSDEEREIGVWRDGKPLYQKTLTVTITSKVQWIETNIDTDSFIIDSRGVLITPNLTNGLIILPNGDPSGLVGIGTIFQDVLSTGTFSLLYRTTSDSLGSGTAYITLWYTKSSDTPGSGTWNQQGAISHHYSTTEKIIGTWIDGKPLYEKTYSLNVTLPASSGATQVSISDLSSLNIDNVISCVGRAKGSSSNAGKMLTSDGARMWCYPDIVNNYIEVKQEQTSSANQFTLFAVTLQYTKTTD